MNLPTASQKKSVLFFLVVSVTWAGLVYILLQLFGKHISDNSIAFLIAQTVLFLGILWLCYYFFIRRAYEKLLVERNNTAEIIKRYDALSATTNDAIWDHDLITGQTFYNTRLQEIFGYSKEDLRNNEGWWSHNIHPDDKERVQQKINNILEHENQLWQDEYHFRCKNGEYKIVQDRSFIVRNETGRPLRLIGAMNDVTEQRQLEQKILQSKLDHKNELGKAILQAYEEERKNIREELHEDVNQVLAAVKMYIYEVNNSHAADETLLKSIEQLDDVIGKIKHISNRLSPASMEYFGLVPSINELILFHTTYNLVDIYFEHTGFTETDVKNPLRIFLYRIIQDLLGNTLAGCNPTTVKLTLQNKGNNIKLHLTDDAIAGTGTEIIAQRKLNLIKTKLEMYDGRLLINTNKQQNAEIEIYL
jgi:two-component system, NarL family, sensor histidine kinase UhpB